MKKAIRIAALLAVGVVMLIPTVVSCKKNNPEQDAELGLVKVLEEISLPDTLRDGSILTNCTFIDKTLTYRIEIDKSTFKNLNADKMKGKALDNLTKGLFSKNLLEVVSKAKGSIKFVMVSGNDSIVQSYSPGELESAVAK